MRLARCGRRFPLRRRGRRCRIVPSSCRCRCTLCLRSCWQQRSVLQPPQSPSLADGGADRPGAAGTGGPAATAAVRGAHAAACGTDEPSAEPSIEPSITPSIEPSIEPGVVQCALKKLTEQITLNPKTLNPNCCRAPAHQPSNALCVPSVQLKYQSATATVRPLQGAFDTPVQARVGDRQQQPAAATAAAAAAPPAAGAAAAAAAGDTEMAEAGEAAEDGAEEGEDIEDGGTPERPAAAAATAPPAASEVPSPDLSCQLRKDVAPCWSKLVPRQPLRGSRGAISVPFYPAGRCTKKHSRSRCTPCTQQHAVSAWCTQRGLPSDGFESQLRCHWSGWRWKPCWGRSRRLRHRNVIAICVQLSDERRTFCTGGA